MSLLKTNQTKPNILSKNKKSETDEQYRIHAGSESESTLCRDQNRMKDKIVPFHWSNIFAAIYLPVATN